MLSPWIYKSFGIGTICAFWCRLYGSESSQSIFINCDFVFRKFLLRYYSKSPSYTTQTRADRFSQSCTKIERVCHKCGRNGHYAKECDASSYVLAIYKELQSLRKGKRETHTLSQMRGAPSGRIITARPLQNLKFRLPAIVTMSQVYHGSFRVLNSKCVWSCKTVWVEALSSRVILALLVGALLWTM